MARPNAVDPARLWACSPARTACGGRSDRCPYLPPVQRPERDHILGPRPVVERFRPFKRDAHLRHVPGGTPARQRRFGGPCWHSGGRRWLGTLGFVSVEASAQARRCTELGYTPEPSLKLAHSGSDAPELRSNRASRSATNQGGREVLWFYGDGGLREKSLDMLYAVIVKYNSSIAVQRSCLDQENEL